MPNVIKQLFKDNRGTSAVELGMLCLCIVVVIIGAISNLGAETDSTWTGVFDKAADAINGS
jgi:Flp pilus assembly pilin Flp